MGDVGCLALKNAPMPDARVLFVCRTCSSVAGAQKATPFLISCTFFSRSSAFFFRSPCESRINYSRSCSDFFSVCLSNSLARSLSCLIYSPLLFCWSMLNKDLLMISSSTASLSSWCSKVSGVFEVRSDEADANKRSQSDFLITII